MFYIFFRFGLIILCLVFGAVFHYHFGISNAWILYLAAGFLTATYLIFGNVWTAFRSLKQGKIKQANSILKYVLNPSWLLKTNRAYYHLTKGLIFLHEKQLVEGEKHLKVATQLGLQKPNDWGMAYLNLAHANYLKKNFGDSRKYLSQSREYADNDLMLQQKLDQLEQALTRLQ